MAKTQETEFVAKGQIGLVGKRQMWWLRNKCG